MIKTLTAFTPQQEALIPKIRDYWINLALHSGKQVQLRDIEGDIEQLYKSLGLKKPLIIILDSYYAQKLAVNLFVNNKGSYTQDKVGVELARQIYGQLPNQAANQPIEFVEQYFGLGFEPWITFYDFFEQIGVVENKQFTWYKQFLAKGIWSIVYYDTAVFICRLPTHVQKDANGRLHSDTGPAVKWADGEGNYFLNGVSFSKELHEKIIRRELSAKDAVNLPNVEQRAVALQYLGYENVLKELKGKVLDSKKLVSTKFPDASYQVIEVNLHDDFEQRNSTANGLPARFIKVACPTTGKETLLRVPPTPQTRTCMGAVAWTFGYAETDYKPVVET